MDLKEEKKWNLALDLAMEEFVKQEETVFTNEGQRKKLLFEYSHKFEAMFDKPQKCVFLGCGKNSILHSHTLQKSGTLKHISEDNHVLQPFFNEKKGTMDIRRRGLNTASSFPGFCTDHEGIFHTFENAKEINKDKDIRLQLFRTICRELQVKKMILNHLNQQKEEYYNLQQSRFNEILLKHLKTFNLDHIELKKVDFHHTDARLNLLNNEIKNLENTIKFFKDEYYKPYSIDIQKGKEKIYYQVVLISQQYIPVCFAGIGTFKVTEAKKTKEILFVLNVIPQHNGTLVILGSTKSNKSYLDNYVRVYFQDALLILVMIESWMIHVSDHWFIKQSIWESIPVKRRDKILSDILDLNKGLFDQYHLSIFDDIRKKILSKIDEENNWPSINKETIDFIKKQKDKLSQVPEKYSNFPVENILKTKGYI
ncbi:hypothetical protein ABEY24_20610 [Peribacillus frigoritolerans]|uniref:hypothetical protein n=1 Tax=Peribacillus frigoritolerans TaxID=450367 RepID=UPI003D26D4DC